MIELSRQTEQPVTVVATGDRVEVGVLNFHPEDEDWYFNPVTLEHLEESGLNAHLLRND